MIYMQLMFVPIVIHKLYKMVLLFIHQQFLRLHKNHFQIDFYELNAKKSKKQNSQQQLKLLLP